MFLIRRAEIGFLVAVFCGVVLGQYPDSAFAKASVECKRWFAARRLKATHDAKCVSVCERIESDLLSLGCYFECQDLCQFNPENLKRRALLEQVKNLTVYYDLNQYELELILKAPSDALSVYVAKNKAERIATFLFKRNDRLDESDAARHFSWALLTCMDIGTEQAKAFLDAHERIDEAATERGMDTANNYRGLEVCAMLKRSKANFSDEAALTETAKAYKAGKLVILKPKEVGKSATKEE